MKTFVIKTQTIIANYSVCQPTVTHFLRSYPVYWVKNSIDLEPPAVISDLPR